MKKRNRLIALLLAGVTAVSMFAGCGDGKKDENSSAGDNKKTGKVYYLNFKPEQADQWKELAAEDTKETGVKVTVETAASGTYESYDVSGQRTGGAGFLEGLLL